MQNNDDLMYNDAFEKHSISIERLDDGEQRNTYTDWKLIALKKPLVSPARPKVNYADSEATDGNHDTTEIVADRVLYNDREGSWSYHWIDVPYTDPEQKWDALLSQIQNFLQGKQVKVTINEDSNYYWIGRLWVEDVSTESHRATVAIHYQFEPYKYELEDYDSGTRTVTTTSSVTTVGSPMSVIPTISIHSNKFAFHQHNALTRAEAIYMLYNLSAAVATNHAHWSVSLTKSKFLDVSEDDYYYDAVLWAEQYGITSGITENIFGGGNVCTRAMFVTMLFAFNWQGQTPSVVSGNAYFSDVPVYSYYFNPVKWAYLQGYVSGDGKGHFMPSEPITREHACAILYKYMGEPSYPSSVASDFSDLAGSVTIAPWYYVAVVKLYNEGIISGYADSTYKPSNYITRGQFVAMLYAAAGRPNVSLYSIPFVDVTSDMYCYNAVKYCYTHGYISGTSETTFSPERAMLRKEMLQVLFLFGNYQAIDNANLDYFDPDGDEDSDATAASGFEAAADVPNTAYYYNAVVWGVMHGITTLNAGHMFYPDQKATRAMAAQMLYKLLKILNGWQDDTSATIDQEGSHHTTYNDIAIGTAQADWRDGYYDSTQNDLISDSNYIRTIFLALTDSDRYGSVSRITVKCPSNYKYKIHWFSAVNSSTQTLQSETSWITGTNSNRAFARPSSATYFMVSATASNVITSGNSYSEDWSYSASQWRQGKIESNGSITTSDTDYIYTNGYTDVTGIGLYQFEFSANTEMYVAVAYYDSSRNYLGNGLGYVQINNSPWVLYASTFPSNTKYIRLCATRTATTSTSDGANITVIATFSSGGGDAIDPSDGASIFMFKTFMKDEYIPPISDVNKWTVDYTDAVLSCYNKDVIDDPMLERASMEITLENSKGTVTTEVQEKDSTVPEMVVVDGENEFTVKGNGTYRIQFKKGSL